MPNQPPKYPIETAIENLINEVRKSVRRVTKFFFIIPKKKMDKYIYLIETLSWLFLTFALLYRLFGRG